jgi:hypothetical protein
MLTLKNAMNVGTCLQNDHRGERLVLTSQWSIPYQQFDGTLSHLDPQGSEVHRLSCTGFYETFVLVSTYARDHDFADLWQVTDQPS